MELKRQKHTEETKLKMSIAAQNRVRRKKHGMSKTHLYNVWQTMISRCENKNRKKYSIYGNRGISVWTEWHNSCVFIKWALENGYKKGLQIDRIDNDKGYCPENCRFVTPKKNSRNRSNTKYLTINGERKCIAEWCETVPISEFTIYWWNKRFGKEYAEKRVSEVINNV